MEKAEEKNHPSEDVVPVMVAEPDGALIRGGMERERLLEAGKIGFLSEKNPKELRFIPAVQKALKLD